MTLEFLRFINLIKEAFLGSIGTEELDFERQLKLASSQGMKTLLFSVFKKYKDAGLLVDEKGLFGQYEMSVRSDVINYTKKQYEVNKVIKELEKNGVGCVILKGDTLSDVYPDSELRMSGDTDIFIDIKNEKKCLKLFKKMGCYVKKRTRSNNQSVIVHEKAGTFEMHISMDTKQVSEIWYDNLELVKEPVREVKVSGVYKYKTLSYTDTALNLVLHVVKHFISGISHMRMLVDTLAFMNKYYDEIDFDRLFDMMAHLNYDTFFKCLLYIGNVYFGFEKLEADDVLKEKAQAVLEDIYNCGLYGFDKLEGQSYTYDIYSKRRFDKFGSKNYKTYKAYKTKILINDTLDLIFKNKYEMMKLYPVLRKHIFLLPFMYVYRFFSCASHFVFGKKASLNENNSSDKEFMSKRLELFEKTDMM